HRPSGLLVPLYRLQQLRPHIRPVAGGQSEFAQQPTVQIDGLVGQVLDHGGHLGGEDHAHGHGGSVAPLVALLVFDRVGQRVPVVEDLAATGLVDVLGYDFGLDSDGAFDEVSEHGAVGASEL